MQPSCLSGRPLPGLPGLSAGGRRPEEVGCACLAHLHGFLALPPAPTSRDAASLRAACGDRNGKSQAARSSPSWPSGRWELQRGRSSAWGAPWGGLCSAAPQAACDRNRQLQLLRRRPAAQDHAPPGSTCAPSPSTSCGPRGTPSGRPGLWGRPAGQPSGCSGQGKGRRCGGSCGSSWTSCLPME